MHKSGMFLLVISLLLTFISGCSFADSSIILYDFNNGSLPQKVSSNNAELKTVEKNGKKLLSIEFNPGAWPNINFYPEDGAWNWEKFDGLKVEVYNPDAASTIFAVQVNNNGASGIDLCNTSYDSAEPGKLTALKLRFNTNKKARFWGMRGLPEKGPLSNGKPIDISKITSIRILVPVCQSKCSLYIKSIKLFKDWLKEDDIKLPIIDSFGQYTHTDWNGKVKTEKDITDNKMLEAKQIISAPEFSDRDKYGGWLAGPKLKESGWFRVEKVNGKWWFVTPEGHLFFSLGMNCVGYIDQTFVDARDGWFERLPQRNNTEFARCYEVREGAQSMADEINGKGLTFNFYMANLIRKYGKNWEKLSSDNACARLKYWGFNTIGNWSNEAVLAENKVPFVVTCTVAGNIKRIEGGGGYWSKMFDVYDPNFQHIVDASIAERVKKYANNKMCLGYFVDNELSWDAVERGPLASKPTQPCRIAEINMLKDRYKSIDALNKAWNTNAKNWDGLRAPEKPNSVCQSDLDDFVYMFAHRYFETVKSTIKKYDGNHLYLGCRFSGLVIPAIRACMEVSDVVSCNLYVREVDPSLGAIVSLLNKPVIIGEFHFGATDRGMFHPGLVDAHTQMGRGKSFEKYVNSVLDCPALVGCHWFQYADEPVCGRYLDGENFNIGFVDVTDTVYPEMVKASREVASKMYIRRYADGKIKN